MKSHFLIHTDVLETADQRISYRLYRNKYSEQGRRLLLLHGAGVAGEDSWAHLLNSLQGWHEVLVPDLRGMGETVDLDASERGYSVEEVVGDQISLLDHLGWWAFDLGGYSFGGLVGMLLKQRLPHRVHKQYLLESALVDRSALDEVIANRQRYSEIAKLLRECDDPAISVMAFLQTVAPNRIASPRGDALSIARLGYRPLGFANALDAVTDAGRRLDRSRLFFDQGDVSSFVGSRSIESMHLLNKQLVEQLDRWHYHPVRGCDHSLPFQKPRQIARQMDLDLARYLSRGS
ncbi:MAG: pimeloyl-ACP methyl ester carboxylesterase [Motiliproteus sp.]|jgi:pimeloyl-ACP methyl ester carboxylesterase